VPKSLKFRENALTISAFTIVTFVSLFVVAKKGIYLVDFGDGQDYLRSASSIFSGHGYLREGLTWPFFRPPGYPFAIACIWKIIGADSIAALKLFNIALHLLSTVIIYRLLRRNYNHKTSLVGIAIFGLNPILLLPLSDIQTEPLILFLFLAFSYLITKKYSHINLVSISLLSISITAVRPEYLFAILLICIILLSSRFRTRTLVVKTLSIIFALTLSLSWWAIQNKKATDSYIILTNATDYLLWNGSTEQIFANYSINFKNNPNFDSEQYIEIQNEIDSRINKWGTEYSSASIGKKSSFWRNEYIQNVKANPVRYLGKTVEKMFIFWRPFLNPSSHGIKTSVISMLILLPITAGTAARLFFIRRKALKDILVLSYLAALAALTAVHMLQMPDQRYKFPLLIPLSALVLAPPIWQFLAYIFSKFSISTNARKNKLN